jgi:hypothetical protein
MSEVENCLRELEEKLLDPEFRCNAEAVSPLVADDFREFGSSGRVYDKTEALAALQNESPRLLTVTEFRVDSLAEDVVLITYEASSSEGKTLRSSVWVRRDGRWQIVFHQGTSSSSGAKAPV